jgi:hypothetical protein
MSTGVESPEKTAPHLMYWNWELEIKTLASWSDAERKGATYLNIGRLCARERGGPVVFSGQEFCLSPCREPPTRGVRHIFAESYPGKEEGERIRKTALRRTPWTEPWKSAGEN